LVLINFEDKNLNIKENINILIALDEKYKKLKLELPKHRKVGDKNLFTNNYNIFFLKEKQSLDDQLIFLDKDGKLNMKYYRIRYEKLNVYLKEDLLLFS
jgi:hypothetical protein